MTIKQSAEIAQFYREIQEWIDAGCPEHDPFNNHIGLCGSLKSWCIRTFYERREDLELELMAQFIESDLDDDYPFNPVRPYWHDTTKKVVYKNSARLAWIKEHAIPSSDVTEQSEG